MGISGASGLRRAAGQPDRPHASSAHQRQQGENGLDHHRHMPAYDVVRSRRSAAINDDRQIEAGVLVEGNGREMAGRAELRGCEGPCLAVRLGCGDNLRHGFFLPAVRNDVQQRRVAGERNRGEIGRRIVGHVAHHQPRDIVRRSVEQHGVAIRRRMLHIEAADRAVAARAVLHKEMNVALGFDLGGDEAREGIDASTRRHGNDDADGAIGKPRLRTRCSRRERCARGRDKRSYGVAPIHDISSKMLRAFALAGTINAVMVAG